MLETKRKLGEYEKEMRKNLAALQDVTQYIVTQDSKKVNPAYQGLLQEQAEIRKGIADTREKRGMFEEALKRYDLLEQSREGRKYLEDAEIEVTLSQMARWGIREEDVK